MSPPTSDVTTPFTLRRTGPLALGLQFLGVVGGVVAFSVWAGEPATTCQWCAPNAFDAAVRRALVADDPLAVAKASHVLSIGVAPALVLGGAVLPALWSPRKRHAAQHAVILVNAFVLTTGLADGVKKLADRERPGFHYGRSASLEAATLPVERNLSFFSGDTAWAFMFVALGAALAHRRGYRSARWIAGVGAVVAVAVALLRVMADMHWATDVMAGALVGTAVGAGLPWALHGREAGP